MSWDLTIENIAGIREGRAEVEPGVNAVRASNWEGKSSFITAIEVAMGTETALTEDAESGRIELDMPDGRAVVELERDGDSVLRSGNPYLSDPKSRISAELFAFLDDGNEVRELVRTGRNLEEPLTRPLDFENIEEQIRELTGERDRVDRRLDEAEGAAEQLIDVERQISTLKDELSSLREQRAELETEQKPDDASEKREALSEALAEQSNVENRIERLERSIQRIKGDLEEKYAELEAVEIPEIADSAIEKKIADLETKRDTYKEDADLIQSIYGPTKRILDDGRLDFISEVERTVEADRIKCWSCGSTVTRETMVENLEKLDERISTLRSQAREFDSELEALREKQAKHETALQRKRHLERKISELENTLEERRTSLEYARDNSAELEDRIDELSAEVEGTDDRLTEVESEIKYTKANLEDLREEREELENRADSREKLSDRRAELTEEIADLRSRKQQMKRKVRNSFETAMQDVLNHFDTGFESAQLTSNFDLVVARNGRSVDLNDLSEGETELLGIVASLAGYQAFEVADEVPVMLIDNLGGLADENLTLLIEYLEDRSDYLVFTSYPEHSPVEQHTINPSDWRVVSPQSA